MAKYLRAFVDRFKEFQAAQARQRRLSTADNERRQVSKLGVQSMTSVPMRCCLRFHEGPVTSVAA